MPLSQDMNWRFVRWLSVEKVASLTIIAAALLCLALFVRAMFGTSLWNDELYSIQHFSSRGPLVVLTDYHVPNNHIFFNLVNSLTPGAQSVNPSRARAWSLVAVAALVVSAVWAFSRRQQWLLGAMLVLVIGDDIALLDLNLQARGYGFVAFSALTMSLLLLYYLRQRKVWQLALLALLALLGTWTIPVFAGFSCALLLLLFLHTRERRVLMAGAMTILAIVAVYLPVLQQLIAQSMTYSQTWGREYASLQAVSSTITSYLFYPEFIRDSVGDWVVFTFLGAVFLLPYVLWKPSEPDGQGTRILVGAVAIFFAFCLTLQTPLIRSTSFVVFPLVVAALMVLGQVIYTPRLKGIFPVICLLIVALASLQSLRMVCRFQFVPIENWLGVARQIERTYPDGMPIYAPFEPSFLRAYLRPSFPLADQFDSQQYVDGKLVVVDSASSVQARFQSDRYSTGAVGVQIPQRRGDFQEVSVSPPKDSYIAQVTVDTETGPTPTTLERDPLHGWTLPWGRSDSTLLSVSLKPGVKYRSLIMLAGKGSFPAGLQAQIALSGGTSLFLDERAATRQGNLLILYLGDRPVESVTLDMKASEKTDRFSIIEMWAYPSVGP
jgi:hypothetical protein